MKKLILSAVAVMASVSMMALTPTAVAVITLTSADGTDKVTLIESAEDGFTAAFDNGYDAIQPDANVPAIYAIVGDTHYATIATDNLDDVTLGFTTGNATDYTLTVTSLSGRELKFYDFVKGEEVVLVKDMVINFTAEANAEISTRFVINRPVVAPEICHRYGKLEVRGSKGMTVQVLNLDGTATSIADQTMATDNEVIDLEGLTAGEKYLVKWNEKELIILM